MQNNPQRIIIDTNLWISFLITKDFSGLDELIFSDRYKLVFSEELITEFIEVSNRIKFRRYFPLSDLEELIESIETYSIFVGVKTNIALCRDAKDNFLLSLAVDGNADFLLTGDKDLLVLQKVENTTIITISDFLLLQ